MCVYILSVYEKKAKFIVVVAPIHSCENDLNFDFLWYPQYRNNTKNGQHWNDEYHFDKSMNRIKKMSILSRTKLNGLVYL